MPGNDTTGYQTPEDAASPYNAQVFLIRSMLARLRTVTLVQIVAVTNSGAVSPVGFVDVQPLVNQTDGAGRAVPHGVLYKCPYFRLQGGGDAIILDPKVGDIGIALFADRDISTVTSTRARGNPGSRRRFDMADGLYLGGVLNGTPTQYVEFSSGGIVVHSPTKVTINAPAVEINAMTTTLNSNVVINGTITQGAGGSGGNASLIGPLAVTNDVTAAGKSLEHHIHSDVQTGSGNTGQPV